MEKEQTKLSRVQKTILYALELRENIGYGRIDTYELYNILAQMKAKKNYHETSEKERATIRASISRSLKRLEERNLIERIQGGNLIGKTTAIETVNRRKMSC